MSGRMLARLGGGLGLGLGFAPTARRAASWHPSSLFEGSEGGFWFDFTEAAALRQAPIGVPAVAAESDPVGLAFNMARWGGKTFAEVMAAQPELAPNGGGPFVSTSSWTAQDSNITLSVDAGRLRLDFVGASSYVWTSLPTIAGESYAVEVEFELGSNATMGSGAIRDQTSSGTPIVGESDTRSASSPIRFFFTALSAVSVLRVGFAKTNPATAYVTRVSAKRVPGNHASQSSSGSRPAFQLTHVSTDGSNDHLVTAQKPTLAGTLIYAGTFEAEADVAIGATDADEANACALRISTDGYLLAAIGDQDKTIIGETDIRGVDGVYAIRWGGDGAAVTLTRDLNLEYAGAQVGDVTTDYPFTLAAANVAGTAGSFLAGTVRHCLFVPRAISNDELAQAVRFLSQA